MNRLPLDEVVQLLEEGNVVAVPTDTVYGLAVDPRRPGAVGRVFALKKRPEQFALPVLISSPGEAEGLGEATPAAARLISAYWPGPLTLVMPRRAGVSLDLGGDPSTIGLRCPANDLVRGLLRRTGPLAVTSANGHGEAPLHTAQQVRERFGEGLAAVLDGGRCDGRASTVVSLIGAEVTCLREGELAFDELRTLAAGS